MMIGGRTFPKFRPGKGWVSMVGESRAASWAVYPVIGPTGNWVLFT
jgi:hypothetical protein